MKIALVGEAFGEEEEKLGKPFVGKAGSQLDKLLGIAGIDRDGCFITNVCFARGTLVLMADLSWKKIQEVQKGDRVVAFDEHGSTRGQTLRRWRIAVVKNTQVRIAKCVILRTDVGELTTTLDHKLLVSSKNQPVNYSWVSARNVRCGKKRSSFLTHILPVRDWNVREISENGWLAGFLDGEGSFCAGGRNRKGDSWRVSVAQADDNGLMDEFVRICRDRGLDIGVCDSRKPALSHHKQVLVAKPKGGFEAQFKLLAYAKPKRLLPKLITLLESKEPPVFRVRSRGRVVGVLKETTEREVFDLTTSTGTFVANGFAVHNCNERPTENDFGIYYEDKARKKPTLNLLNHHARLRNDLVEQGFADGNGVVIALGNEALYALTGLRGIEQRRGSILKGVNHDFKVIPTFHPAAVARIGGESVWYLPAAHHDLGRAKSECGREFPEMPGVRVSYQSKDLSEFLESTRGKKVAFDLETAYEHQGEEISSIAFASYGDSEMGKSLVLPLFRERAEEIPPAKKGSKPKTVWIKEDIYSSDEFLKIQSLVRMFFENFSWLKIGQNIQFDINVLRRLGWIERVEGLWMDTMIAHTNCVAPEFPHDLGFLTSWYTRIPYYKHLIDSRNEEFWNYNGYDAIATLECAEGIERDMGSFGTREFYHGYLNRLVPLIADMNLRGISINRLYQKELQSTLRQSIKQEKSKLDHLTKEGIDNHNSPSQVAAYLYKHKGYNPILLNGRVTTNELALKRLFKKTRDPVIEVLLKLRELEKRLSTYANLKSDEGGVVRTSYSFAKTGRFRSGGGKDDQ